MFTDFEKGDVLIGTYNTWTKNISLVMPDNEELTGKYIALSNAAFTFGTGTAYSGSKTTTASGYSISSGGSSQVYALLKSTKSKLMIEVIAQYSSWTGNGFGEARTNDGRVFKVQF